MKAIALLPLIFLFRPPAEGETINVSGGNGSNGSSGMNPGDDGGSGTAGESVSRTAEGPGDADKSMTLVGGRGGRGGDGRDSNVFASGSGGSAGAGGEAVATANLTLNLPTQWATITANGGLSGNGGHAGAGNSMIYGHGQEGSPGGNSFRAPDFGG